MKESDLQKQILHLINSEKGFFAWRNQSTGIKTETGWRKKGGFDIKGVSDILGIHLSGRMIAVEVKSPELKVFKPSPQQEAFLEKIKKMNGYAICTNNLNDVKLLIEKVREENGLGS